MDFTIDRNEQLVAGNITDFVLKNQNDVMYNLRLSISWDFRTLSDRQWLSNVVLEGFGTALVAESKHPPGKRILLISIQINGIEEHLSEPPKNNDLHSFAAIIRSRNIGNSH